MRSSVRLPATPWPDSIDPGGAGGTIDDRPRARPTARSRSVGRVQSAIAITDDRPRRQRPNPTSIEPSAMATQSSSTAHGRRLPAGNARNQLASVQVLAATRRSIAAGSPAVRWIATTGRSCGACCSRTPDRSAPRPRSRSRALRKQHATRERVHGRGLRASSSASAPPSAAFSEINGGRRGDALERMRRQRLHRAFAPRSRRASSVDADAIATAAV